MVEQLVDDIYNCGFCVLKKGDFDKAIYYLKLAIQLTQDSNKKVYMYNVLGLSYFQLGLYGIASDTFKLSNGIKESENDAKKYFESTEEIKNIFEGFNKRNTTIEEKIQKIENIIEHYPGNVALLNYLGILYAKLKKYSKAKKYFEKVLDTYPNNVDTLKFLAKLSNRKLSFWQYIKVFFES